MNKPLTLLPWLFLSISISLSACSESEEPKPTDSVSERLTGSTEGYQSANQPIEFQFPKDHASHPSFKQEWWYFTGQLITAEKRRFGFQFTIFREAISPQRAQSTSNWSTNQLYLAHAALSDIENKRYLFDERFSRDALDLAGAQDSPFKVWLENWRVEEMTVDDKMFQVKLSADTENFSLDIDLKNTKPPVYHGKDGLSYKSHSGNSASYYYSYSHLDTHGKVIVDRQTFEVSGSAWFDHEWSTSALEPDQAGWDWFSLQLSNHQELMLFRLRHKENPQGDFYSGTFINEDGSSRTLGPKDFKLEATRFWKSPKSGSTYPIAWRINIPSLGMELTVNTRMENQEFDSSFRYWEGAVSIQDENSTITGQGYLEMTGY